MNMVANMVLYCWITFTPQPDSFGLNQRSVKSVEYVVARAGGAAQRMAAEASVAKSAVAARRRSGMAGTLDGGRKPRSMRQGLCRRQRVPRAAAPVFAWRRAAFTGRPAALSCENPRRSVFRKGSAMRTAARLVPLVIAL